MSLDETKRKAAGAICLLLFHVVSSAANTMRAVADTSPARADTCGDGLSDKEREAVRRVAAQLYDAGQKLRKLGWRFHGRNFPDTSERI